jgi:hypothetical protein
MSSNETVIISIRLGKEVINILQKDDSLNKKIGTTIKSNFTDSVIILNDTLYHTSIFNSILDNAIINSSQLINVITIGLKYFSNLVISTKLQKKILVWVKRLGKHSYTWDELLNKPNYGLEIFNKRFYPYFSIECKEWNEIGSNVQESDYPHQSDTANNDMIELSTENEINKDYKVEYNISQKYNNFLGHQVIEPADYINMDKILDKLKLLKLLNLKSLMFESILRLLITPSTCHIFKFDILWELVNPLFKENNMYKDIFMHFMYYALYIFNHEYTVMFSRIKRNYRIIFTHNEALLMPSSINCHINTTPYIQQLTGDKSLIQSIPYYLHCNRKFNSIEIFERRFYLATGGALANIHLSKYNAAVSGSILIPCVSYNELENDFKYVRFNTKRSINTKENLNYDIYQPVGSRDKLTETEKDFMSYLEYFYPSYHSLPTKDYMSILTKKGDEKRNIDKNVSIDTDKNDKKVLLKYNLISDIDISISTDNYDTFSSIAQILGKQIQKNCEHIGDVWIQKIYTAASFKYKLYGPGLIRPIDLFKIPYGPSKMVKKFHCPIVRSWYDGSNSVVPDLYKHSEEIENYWKVKSDNIDNDYEEITKDDLIDTSNSLMKKPTANYVGVNILYSCLTTILSGVNGNYKWFFSNKPCVEVILKYTQRGFATILNPQEIKAIILYMKSTPKWKNFVGDNIDMCGSVSKDHIFFNPSNINAGIRYGLREFKKPIYNIYSKKLYVGTAKTKTVYGEDLNIKHNNKVVMPDIKIINAFTEYIDNNDKEALSDDDL